MGGRGELISCDIHPHKTGLIANGAQRLHLTNITPRLQDASQFVPEWENAMDAVIADVPCSGLGIIRKKPDIRYKNLKDTEELPELQLKILENQSRYVKKEGLLLYSTCTVLRRENEDVVKAFPERDEQGVLHGIEIQYSDSGIRAYGHARPFRAVWRIRGMQCLPARVHPQDFILYIREALC